MCRHAIRFIALTALGAVVSGVGEVPVAIAQPASAIVTINPGPTGTWRVAPNGNGAHNTGILEVTLLDAGGFPVVGYPKESITLQSCTGEPLAFCPGGLQADADTDAAGKTTLNGIGATGGGWSSQVELVVGGNPMPNTCVALGINSPDINGDLIVNFLDASLFSQDLQAPYAFRSDFDHDGQVTLSDYSFLTSWFGSPGCPPVILCQVANADLWQGPDLGNFTDPTNWSGGIYPLVERASLRNNGGVPNSAVLLAGPVESVCAVDISGPGALQTLRIEDGAQLQVANQVSVSDGGQLDLRGTSVGAGVQALVQTSGTGIVSGTGTVDRLDNAGNLQLVGGQTLTISTSANNSGTARLSSASIQMPAGVPFVNTGNMKSTLAATFVGDVDNQTGGLFEVCPAITSVSGCFTNQVGATLHTYAGGTFLVLGCGSVTNFGTITTGGICPAKQIDTGPAVMELAGGLSSAKGSALRFYSETVLRLGGDLDIAVDEPDDLDLSRTSVEFTGTGLRRLEATFGDRSRDNPAPMARLVVGRGVRLRLVDVHPNMGPRAERVRVANLILEPGCTLDLAGLVLSYQSITPPDPMTAGSTVRVVDSVGGGRLASDSVSEGARETAPRRGNLWVYAPQPNPFNPQTTIRWSMANTMSVDVTIFTLRGERVRKLDLGELGAGENTVRWDGNDDAGHGVASGSYVIRVRAGREVRTTRATLVR